RRGRDCARSREYRVRLVGIYGARSRGPPLGLRHLQAERGPLVVAGSALDRLREICLALPEATEKPFSGHTDPTWRVRERSSPCTAITIATAWSRSNAKRHRERKTCWLAPRRGASLNSIRG